MTGYTGNVRVGRLADGADGAFDDTAFFACNGPVNGGIVCREKAVTQCLIDFADRRVRFGKTVLY